MGDQLCRYPCSPIIEIGAFGRPDCLAYLLPELSDPSEDLRGQVGKRSHLLHRHYERMPRRQRLDVQKRGDLFIVMDEAGGSSLLRMRVKGEGIGKGGRRLWRVDPRCYQSSLHHLTRRR